MARNVDNLNKVAEACKKAGAPEVLVLSKDLSIAEDCISAVEDTVAHFKGDMSICKLKFAMPQLSHQYHVFLSILPISVLFNGAQKKPKIIHFGIGSKQ